jgi:hypothetical protein
MIDGRFGRFRTANSPSNAQPGTWRGSLRALRFSLHANVAALPVPPDVARDLAAYAATVSAERPSERK